MSDMYPKGAGYKPQPRNSVEGGYKFKFEGSGKVAMSPTDGGDICLNDYWYELCNKAKEDIILSTDTFLPITCCCLSS